MVAIDFVDIQLCNIFVEKYDWLCVKSFEVVPDVYNFVARVCVCLCLCVCVCVCVRVHARVSVRIASMD